MIKPENTGTIILAAGASRRLGEPKQLVKFRGKALLQHVVDLAADFRFSTNVLVLGANAPAIQSAIDTRGFHLLENTHWEDGLSTSIRCGLDHSLQLNPDTAHVLLLLADQPFVSAELLQQLIETHSAAKKTITACAYQGLAGVPAIFSRKTFPELLALTGDQGAKKVIQKHLGETNSVEFDLGAFDVDTQEDLQKLKAQNHE